jgi:hypothetical protein
MSTEPSPLKYMGTQSQETVGMAAALALAAERAKERRSYDDGYVSDVDRAGSRIADAASWALAQGKDALQSIAVQLRKRANVALARYTQRDPLRAMLIAAGAGALLAIYVARMGRSGVRSARRSLR